MRYLVAIANDINNYNSDRLGGIHFIVKNQKEAIDIVKSFADKGFEILITGLFEEMDD